MTMPCRWSEGGLGEFAGRVRFRRRFGYPGRIDEHERVWLTFDGVEGTANVTLNGDSLGRRKGDDGPFEFEVTRLLRQRNELTVEVVCPSPHGGLWGEVALEVRCTAFLRGVRIEANPVETATRLHVTGKLVGTCERPLELYLLLDRSTVLYTTLEAVPEGRAFSYTTEPLTTDASREHVACLELVNGAVVWYALEQPLRVAEAPSP
jgi:hypothetical protein